VNRLADQTETDLGTLGDHRHVVDPDWRAILRLQHCRLMSGTSFIRPNRANVESLLAVLDETAAGVHVVIGQRLLHLRQAQSVADQLIRVDLHLVFARDAAEAGDVDNVRNGLQLLHDHPIVERLSSIRS